MAQDLRSKLAASGTLAVPRRAGAALPNDVSLKVFRFATTQDLGRLGRTGTAWRDLSLRELTRLPGDWEVRRMAAPDHRVYFRSVAHERAQWEKPTRAAPPPAVDATSDGTPADVYPPQHNWPNCSAPRPKRTWARAARPSAQPPDRPSAWTRARRRARQLVRQLVRPRARAPPWACPACTYRHTGAEAGFLQCAACGGNKPTEITPGDWAMAWFDDDVFWCSYNLRASQWERPVYEDAPRFRLLMDGQIARANAHYRTRAGSNYLDRSP